MMYEPHGTRAQILEAFTNVLDASLKNRQVQYVEITVTAEPNDVIRCNSTVREFGQTTRIEVPGE